MVSVLKRAPATYADLEALPEDQKAELIDGVLYLMTGPKGRHIRFATVLGALLCTRFGLSLTTTPEGPGGWWILFEPEVHLALDRRVVRPDLAGWRRERMPVPPSDSHKFTTVPDWVCEILSPSTASRDAFIKMPRYLEAGVQWAWIVDPVAGHISVLRAGDGAPREREWVEVGGFEGAGPHRIPPFDEVALDLAPALVP
ncbi:MAG: Uma2 family endonuclease [Deltaproteobacteria bacterium]|nr:Uma2 family endonuclease [Deltaproteobacteria bacterium]